MYHKNDGRRDDGGGKAGSNRGHACVTLLKRDGVQCASVVTAAEATVAARKLMAVMAKAAACSDGKAAALASVHALCSLPMPPRDM
jgi:hypothetical protein